MNFFHRRDRHRQRQRHADDMYLTKTIVLAGVRRDGNNLKYASNASRNDREVVLAALRNNYGAYLHASSELQRDKKILTTALRMNGHLRGIAPKELRGDLEVVMAASDQDPSSLQFASQEFFVALAKLGLDSRQEQQQEPVKGTQKNEEDLTREELLAQNRALRKRLAEAESPRNESATKKPRVKRGRLSATICLRFGYVHGSVISEERSLSLECQSIHLADGVSLSYIHIHCIAHIIVKVDLRKETFLRSTCVSVRQGCRVVSSSECRDLLQCKMNVKRKASFIAC